MLLEALRGLPAEALGQGPRADGSLPGQLQLREQSLQLVRDAVVAGAVEGLVVLPPIDELSEIHCHIKRL